MLKGIGVTLLLLTSFWVGITMRSSVRRRITLLKETIQLVSQARRKIDLFNTPIDALFDDFLDGTDGRLWDFLSDVPSEKRLCRIAESLGEYGRPLYKLISEFGSGYKDDTLRLCDYCCEELEDTLHKAEEAYSRQKKLYIALPLLLAVSLIVLLL